MVKASPCIIRVQANSSSFLEQFTMQHDTAVSKDPQPQRGQPMPRPNEKFMLSRRDELKVRPLPGSIGPLAAADIRDAEGRLGRALPSDLVTFLTVVGGTMGFETGGVDVGDTGLIVRTVFGVGHDYDIAERSEGYRGQIPAGWIPFADSIDGHFYCLDDGGAVWYVELEEEFWARETRPPAPPPGARLVASSFAEFLRVLRLPAWADQN